MSATIPGLNASQAAQRLGVSAKALRLYERGGLLRPTRSATGWRVYNQDAMVRAAEIVSLRALGLSLAQVSRVLLGDGQDLGPALAAHQSAIEGQIRELAGTAEKVCAVRAELDRGLLPGAGQLACLIPPFNSLTLALDLPWPWDGERFELADVRALNYLTGPLGSGKTRLAHRIAQTIPGGVFLGLERLSDNGAALRKRMDADLSLKSRVEETVNWLLGDGATVSDALLALLAGLECEPPFPVVVDMVEQGLDHATQEALVAHLRRRPHGARPLFLLTRSSAILDLGSVGPDETIIFCPANHAVPSRIVPYPGVPGYEALATCLASPEVRRRTEGVIAWRSQPVS